MINLINPDHIVRNCTNKTKSEKVSAVTLMITKGLTDDAITELTNLDKKTINKIRKSN